MYKEYVFILTDVEIKVDEKGYVLPANQNDEIYERYMVLRLN